MLASFVAIHLQSLPLQDGYSAILVRVYVNCATSLSTYNLHTILGLGISNCGGWWFRFIYDSSFYNVSGKEY